MLTTMTVSATYAVESYKRNLTHQNFETGLSK